MRAGNVAEHETKYVFRNATAHVLVRWLELHCRPDPEFPEGVVASVYFDAPDWRYLREKIDSDYEKTKVRVRWYADARSGAPGSPAFLEVKRKLGRRREKLRIATDVPGERLASARFDDPALTALPRLLGPRGIVVRGSLVPTFQIRYRRRRFVDPVSGARLCVDTDICAPAANPRVLPRVRPAALREGVLELKGAQTELPGRLRPLVALGARLQSFSKYAVCYRSIVGGPS